MRAFLLAFAFLAADLSSAVAADPGIVSRSRTPSAPPPAALAALAASPAAGSRADVVRILAQFGATIRLCTGVMVAPRIAITAGRCVHEGANGDFALDYWVQPGSDGTTHPFGQAFGAILTTFTEWTQRSDPNFDIGFIVLDRALGDQSGYVTPTRSEGCISYGGVDLSWVGYVAAGSGQVAEQGSAACTDGALTVASTSTFAAGSPLFASEGRVHGISSTRAGGQVRFTRLNTRVLTYFTDTLLRSIDPCNLSIETNLVELGAGSGEVMVAVTTGQGCTWSVDTALPSWLEVQGTTTVGFGRPVFRAAANAGPARSAVLTIGGQPLLIAQAGAGVAPNTRFLSTSTIGGAIVSTQVDTAGAGRDPDAPAPAGATGGAGAWWRWTAPTTTFTTAAATSDRFSPTIGVYTGSRPGALTLVAEGRESVAFTGTAGTSYLIFVAGMNGGGGPVRLLVEQLFPGAEAQTGWWWDPDEPGRGVFIETNGASAFLGWFAYDNAGRWLWQVSRGEILTRRYYQGGLATFSGGQTLGGDYRAPTFVGDGGSITLSMSAATRATLSSGTASVGLERFSFAAGGPAADRAPFVPETGWWWAPSEPGTGYALEVQGNQMMLGIAHFDTDGSPRWSLALGAMSDARLFEGKAVSYLGGQALGQSYRAPTATADSGRVSIIFSDSTHATALLPGGRKVTIERFRY